MVQRTIQAQLCLARAVQLTGVMGEQVQSKPESVYEECLTWPRGWSRVAFWERRHCKLKSKVLARSQAQQESGALKEVLCYWRCGVCGGNMISGKGWRGEPQSGHTGLEAGCVEELAFILTALGEGLQRLALGGGVGCYICV